MDIFFSNYLRNTRKVISSSEVKRKLNKKLKKKLRQMFIRMYYNRQKSKKKRMFMKTASMALT